MNPIERLEKFTLLLEKRAEELIEANQKFSGAEHNYNLIRATLLQMDIVANLPNQAMRDAEIEKLLENDTRFRPTAEDYMRAKLEQKKAYILWDLVREACSNQRAIVNSGTFSKTGESL
jgi:hypothetical protein